MKEFFEILEIIGCGLLGISIAVFLKLQDITEANENLNLKQVTALFFKKAWASYFMSITVVIVYAITHESWIEIFTGEKDSHSIVSKIIGMVMVMGTFVGFAMQYGYYRIGLKKLDKIMKAWGGDSTDRTDTQGTKPNDH